MREILFRGKRKVNAAWVYGFYVEHPIGNDSLYTQIVDKNGWTHDVSQETVGQFTGMRDKNGREIYEGDIVKYASWIFEPEGTLPVGVGNGKVYFKYGCFCVTGAQYEDECALIDCEVIGNIHDNPELLEGNV